MPRWVDNRSSNNAGEFSRNLRGRYDLKKYRNACKALENMTVLVQGGARFRSGFQYIASVKNAAKKTRLKRFKFSTEQAYMLEFGDSYVRFYKDLGQILYDSLNFLDADVDTTDNEIDVEGHGYYDDLGPVQLTTTGTLPDGLSTGVNYYISRTDNDSFGLATSPGGSPVSIASASGGGTHTITPLGNVIVEVATTYTEDEVSELNFCQSADTLYIWHKNHHPATLVRYDHDRWALADVEFTDGPWLDDSYGRITPTIGYSGHVIAATSGTLTASGTGHKPFLAGRDEGRRMRLFRWDSSTTNHWGVYEISSVTSKTVANAVCILAINNVSDGLVAGQGRYKWSPFYPGNYPTTGMFAEQRLWIGGVPSHPQRIWGSRTGLFHEFSPDGSISGDYGPITVILDDNDPQDDHGIDFTIGTDEVNTILWVRSGKELIFGTSGGLFKMSGGDNGSITPNSVRVVSSSRVGSGSIEPSMVNNTIMYAARSNRRIMASSYSVESDDFSAVDLNTLAGHMLSSGIVQTAQAQEINNELYVVRGDGQIAVLAYMPDQEVSAWGRIKAGGSFNNGIAVIESCDVIPSVDESWDQPWIIVKRTINGQTRRYIEARKVDFRQFDEDAAIETAFFVDSGLSLDGAGANDPVTITGATAADPVVITAPAHGYSNGDHVRIRGINGMSELNHKIYRVNNKTTNTFELQTLGSTDIDGSAYSAYVSGGTVRKTTTSITGLDHLEGETVTVQGDGSRQPDKTVSGGAITLSTEAAEVHVGLGYSGTMETMGIDPPSPGGASYQGKMMRPHRAVLRFNDTVGGTAGQGDGTLDEVDTRLPSDPMSGPRQPRDFNVMVELDGEWDYEPSIKVVQSAPLPMTLISISTHGQSGDE